MEDSLPRQLLVLYINDDITKNDHSKCHAQVFPGHANCKTVSERNEEMR
jgi:hypothetical protein